MTRDQVDEDEEAGNTRGSITVSVVTRLPRHKKAGGGAKKKDRSLVYKVTVSYGSSRCLISSCNFHNVQYQYIMLTLLASDINSP